MDGTFEISNLPSCSKWDSLSEYEKQRYSNVVRNWEVLKSIGITSKLPKCLDIKKESTVKVNIPRNQQKISKTQQNILNFEKTNFKLFAVPKTHKKKVQKSRKRIIQNRTKKGKLEENVKIIPKEIGLKKFAKSLLKRSELYFKVLEPFSSEEELTFEIENETEFESPKRYPKRNVKKKSYEEEDVSSEDEFLYCDDCDCDYKGPCPEHGPMLWVCDRRVPKNTPDRAALTLPSFLSIGRSNIPKAGLGIWTEIPLAKGTVFGPYKGKIIKTRKEAEKSGYAWMVWKGGKTDHFIEGFKQDISNWLRFVNCADKEEKQNLVAIQYKKQIYYKTYRDVLPFQELLVWYGGKYAADLGINLSREPDTNKISVGGIACDICGSLFTSVEIMERHRKQHPHRGPDRRHSCPYCDYSTDKKTNIRDHLTVHTGERRHKCPHCHKTFTQEWNLKIHLLIHSGERAFSCGVCGRDFTQKGNLQIHERIHSGITPYRCPTCGRDFKQPSDLRKHERVHTRQRPYKCSLCDYRAAQSSSLNSHVIHIHTKQFPHKCHMCDKGFVSPRLLIQHIDKAHS